MSDLAVDVSKLKQISFEFLQMCNYINLLKQNKARIRQSFTKDLN